MDRAPRFDLHVLVRLRVKGSPSHLGHARDLSQSGMQVEVDEALVLGAHVAVEFFLPGQLEPVSLSAEVVRRAGSSYGLRFLDLSPDQATSIHQMLDRRARTARAQHV